MTHSCGTLLQDTLFATCDDKLSRSPLSTNAAPNRTQRHQGRNSAAPHNTTSEPDLTEPAPRTASVPHSPKPGAPRSYKHIFALGSCPSCPRGSNERFAHQVSKTSASCKTPPTLKREVPSERTSSSFAMPTPQDHRHRERHSDIHLRQPS